MNELVTKDEQPTWTNYITEVQPRFEAIAKDNAQVVKWREESYFALQALKGNHYLAKSAPDTVQSAIINVAAVGLTLNPADGYAYLVGEFNKETQQVECQLRISFRGLIKSATDTGSIAWVRAEVVKASDKFDYRGPCTLPDHSIDAFSKDRGDSTGVYCIAKTNEGDFLVDIMPWKEVLKIKECAKTKKVWDKWPDEMAKKAIIKRAAKQWPKTAKSGVFHKAIEVINEAEGTDYLAPYTDSELETFTSLWEAQDALGYRLYCQSLSEAARDALNGNLVKVIPKGQGRMKIKEKMRKMDTEGFELNEQIILALEDEEAGRLAECMEDSMDITKELLLDSLAPTQIQTYNSLMEAMNGSL